jgi:hypothetical protein
LLDLLIIICTCAISEVALSFGFATQSSMASQLQQQQATAWQLQLAVGRNLEHVR